MLEDIFYFFDKNYGRTKNLLKLYNDNFCIISGRKTTEQLDLLRATVVLLHSTLEDFLRNLLLLKLPFAQKDKLNKIPLLGTSEDGRRTKFELGELLEHKDLSIQELINKSIADYLNKVSFNDTNDIVKNLSDIDIEITDEIKRYFPMLNEMIKRRHSIVHQADREITSGSGNHKIKSISYKKVLLWQTNLDKFIKELVKQLN